VTPRCTATSSRRAPSDGRPRVMVPSPPRARRSTAPDRHVPASGDAARPQGARPCRAAHRHPVGHCGCPRPVRLRSRHSRQKPTDLVDSRTATFEFLPTLLALARPARPRPARIERGRARPPDSRPRSDWQWSCTSWTVTAHWHRRPRSAEGASDPARRRTICARGATSCRSTSWSTQRVLSRPRSRCGGPCCGREVEVRAGDRTDVEAAQK
jgi:hypothetical protein